LRTGDSISVRIDAMLDKNGGFASLQPVTAIRIKATVPSQKVQFIQLKSLNAI
jgi:hypothetical protein